MPRDLQFQALALLSQYIVSSRNIPEGIVFQKTSCMNPDDAELIGTLLATLEMIEKEDPELAHYLKSEVIPFFEKVAISKWVKGELTHLGFRAGTRYQEQIDIASEAMNEADVLASATPENTE